MKKILGVILILIIAALIFALIYFKGFGGFGKDSGENKKDDTSVAETTVEKTEATTEELTEIKSVDITVSGRDYLFNNEKISLDALITEIGKFDKDSSILISYDNTATKNTMDDLTDKLDELGYKNYEKVSK